MKSFMAKTGLALGLVLGAAGAAPAQQPADVQQGDPGQQQTEGQHKRHGRGGRGHKMGGHRGGRGMGFLRGLELTDAQREQLRAIHQRYAQSTQAQRQELRQIVGERRLGNELNDAQKSRAEQLRAELRATHRNVENEILSILTPEQRAQAEQHKREHEARREQFRQRRRQRQNDDQQ